MVNRKELIDTFAGKAILVKVSESKSGIRYKNAYCVGVSLNLDIVYEFYSENGFHIIDRKDILLDEGENK
jgi:hypothetical protein